jgi:hypothetical protein
MKKTTATLLILLFISYSSLFAQVQVDKFSGDASYGLPLITVPNFRGPSVSTSIYYKSDIKVDQPASEVGLGWNINAGGSVERYVNGVPDDWKAVDVPDMQAASFQKHLGSLYLNVPNTYSTVLDFDYLRYKMDTLNDTIKYYYPNYDTYFVTGAGMAGKISPENYDYANVTIDTSKVKRWFYNKWWSFIINDWVTDSISIGVKEIETYSINGYDRPFNYKTHFRYEHNLYDEVDAKHYPWTGSPLTSNSAIHIPNDTTDSLVSTFIGEGYNNENYSINANKNRTRTSNYIEYFTNEEIDLDNVSNFMEYDTTFNRSVEANFPQAGIGAYRITDPNGYTYHYSLPVYAHYNTSGSFSLDKDYKVVIAEGGIMEITDSTNGYIVENETTHEILEIKQVKKYAIRWLLTAITGPDFDDVNSNGIVDLADEGYWVKYDYGLWTESFASRYPYYGSKYSFSSSLQESLQSRFMDDNDSSKVTGKMLAYSETANQKYYLNDIQTPSHTAIFSRALRYDEQSMLSNFDRYEYTSSENLKNVTETIDYQNGSGNFSFGSSLTNPIKYFRTTINPEGVDSIKLFIDELFVGGYNDTIRDTLRVYDGMDSTGTILYEKYYGYESATVPTSVTSSSNVITIEYTWTTENSDKGNYAIRWESKFTNALSSWPAGRFESIPELKLSKMFLFDNDDLDSLPTISAMDTILNDELWDYDNVNRSNFYNDDWYIVNKTIIDGLALQSVDLEQDYSLAKGYHNNRFVYVDVYSKSSTPIEVEDNKYVNTTDTASSGKLTLNKVIYYGLNREQTQPSHLFDYNASNNADNPEYNSLLQDYWGNYKSDADTNLLRGYVTDDSKSATDAWSLRKITSPLGGVTEIIYESDEYEQVLSEEKGGSLRGPIKTFALKNVLAVGGDVGRQWTFDLENQASDFWNIKDSLPLGASAYTIIPCVWIDTEDSSSTGHYWNDASGGFDYGSAISYGTGNLTQTGSKIDSLSFIDINHGTTYSLPLVPNVHGYWITPHNIAAADSLVYAGNGYVAFEYPVGEKVYGGGTRVKELKVSSEAETYTVSYVYDEGTATVEAGDFSRRKSKVDKYDNRYDWVLTANDYNPFGMSSQVGYGKVTIENKGQVAAGEGKSIFSFHVSDDNRNYFEPYEGRLDTSWISGVCPPSGNVVTYNKRFGIEIIDDFTTIWGKIKEQTLEDVNGNMVSKKVYEYEASTKGAQVSTVNYEIDYGKENTSCSKYHAYLLSIFRTYPNYLKKVTTYSNGRKSESEIIARDPFTADPIETKNTSINGTVSKEEIVLAYTQTSTPDYSTMGAKSDNPSNDNFLNAAYSSKTLRASEGLTTTDFSSYGKSFWKKSAKTWFYDDDATEKRYKTKIETINWYDYTKYAWAGDLGNYGLFDSSAFTEITSPPSGASDWRFISEVTLLDEQQNVLEQKGFNDRFSASKLSYDNRFTYTSAFNSNYVSFTATGFETTTEVESGVNYYEGEVKAQDDTQLKVDGNVYPHTGNYMVKIPSANNDGPIYKVNYDATEGIYSLQRGRSYTASVWVHKDSPVTTKLNINIEGDTATSYTYSKSDTMSIANSAAIQIGDWIQLTVNIEVPADFTGTTAGDGIEVYVDKSTSASAWIDDMQFKSRVTGSGMNVYDQKTGRVMATLSDNNFATRYVYNDSGQVIEVWKEVLGDTWGKWVKVESRDFNFQRAME